MSHRLIGTIVSALCVGWLATPAAHGQLARRAAINRPSSWAPSRRMAWTGGVYTREYSSVSAQIRRGETGVGGGGRRGVLPPNYFGAGRRVGNLPRAAIPQAFTLGQSRYSPGRAAEPMFRWQGGVRDWDLRRASRLEATMKLWMPLMGAGPYHRDMPNQPYYAPEPLGTAFHEFFRLNPAETEAAAEEPVQFDSLAAILEQENEEFLRQMTARAQQAFKLAMTPGAEDRVEALAKAQTMLTAVRDLDPAAYIPCLLLVHTGLEKSQVRLAVLHLADAVLRHPTLFADRPDLASYFGDPEVLEEQMRKYLRIGDDNPKQPGAYALQAYCAWVLNDRTRVKYALEQMAVASEGTEDEPRMNAIRYALAAAMK